MSRVFIDLASPSSSPSADSERGGDDHRMDDVVIEDLYRRLRLVEEENRVLKKLLMEHLDRHADEDYERSRAVNRVATGPRPHQ